MSIPVTCNCGARFAAQPHLAGKQANCPQCGGTLTIPQPNAPSLQSQLVASCTCGQSFQAKPELAGQQVQCPACGNPLLVPSNPTAPSSAPNPAPSPAPVVTSEQPIAVACACGQQFQAKPHLIGQQVTCPACQQPQTIGQQPAQPAAPDPFDMASGPADLGGSMDMSGDMDMGGGMSLGAAGANDPFMNPGVPAQNAMAPSFQYQTPKKPFPLALVAGIAGGLVVLAVLAVVAVMFISRLGEADSIAEVTADPNAPQIDSDTANTATQDNSQDQSSRPTQEPATPESEQPSNNKSVAESVGDVIQSAIPALNTPEGVYLELLRLQQVGEWEKVFEYHSRELRDQFNNKAKENGFQSGKALYANIHRQLAELRGGRPTGPKPKLSVTKIEGNKCVLTADRSVGTNFVFESVPMIKENGFWKVHVESRGGDLVAFAKGMLVIAQEMKEKQEREAAIPTTNVSVKKTNRPRSNYSEFESLGISPNGKFVACGTEDGNVIVIDGTTGAQISKLALYEGIGRNENEVRLVAISSDGQRIATTYSGREANTIDLWDGSGERIAILNDKTYAQLLRFTPNSDQLAVIAGNDLAIFDAERGKLKGQTRLPNPVRSLSFSQDASIVALGHFNGIVMVRRIADGSEVFQTLYGVDENNHYARPSVSLALDGTQLLARAKKKPCVIWSLPDGKELARFKEEDESNHPVAILLKDRQQALFISKGVNLYDYSGKRIMRYKFSAPTSQIAFSRNGLTAAYFASNADSANEVSVWSWSK